MRSFLCSVFFLYAAAPFAAKGGIVFLFVLLFAVIITMYGGGFSTIPAYLADIFGTHYVGAIHGRLLTAWSTAGVLGPVLVNYIREYQLSIGVPREAAYNQTMSACCSSGSPSRSRRCRSTCGHRTCTRGRPRR